MKGPGVRPGVELKGASIADIAPTILYALGLAVPDRMDGRALQDAFTSEFISGHSLKGSAEKVPPQGPTSEPAYTAHEEDLVRHRLRDLGYIA